MGLIENLQTIKNEKDTKIIPENIKKDVQIFDITGIYEGSTMPKDIHLVKLWQKNILSGSPKSFGNVIAISGSSDQIARILIKDTEEIITLSELDNSIIKFIYQRANKNYIIVSNKRIDEYDENFDFIRNIHTETGTLQGYFDEHHKTGDGYYTYYNRYILIATNSTKVWYYDLDLDEINVIEFPTTFPSKQLAGYNGDLYLLDYNNHKLYKYDLEEKELTSIDAPDSNNYSYEWPGYYVSSNKTEIGFIYYPYRKTGDYSNTYYRILLNNGTFSNELNGVYLWSFTLYNENYIFYEKWASPNTTFYKISRETGEKIQMNTYTGSVNGYSDMQSYIYNNWWYMQVSPVKININTNEVVVGNYTGTSDIVWNQKIGDEVLYFDSNHFYRMSDDGTMTTIYTLDDEDYRCGFSDTYEFTSGSKSYILMYTTGRNMHWWQKVDNPNFGAMMFIYDKQSKTIEKLFPYNTSFDLLLNDSGNGIEFSVRIKPDLENNVIYIYTIPPTEDSMCHGIFGGAVYALFLMDNTYSFQQVAAYAGRDIGKDYMFVGNHYVSNGLDMWSIRDWQYGNKQPDWWNYPDVVELGEYNSSEQKLYKEWLYIS